MSQQDVLESLEKSKKELSAKQISKKIGICNNLGREIVMGQGFGRLNQKSPKLKGKTP